MTFLEEVRRKVEKEEKACVTCGNLVRIGGTLIGGDVFVCPFCCADLARTEAGIPRKCPECGQPIERKQSHDRKKA